MVSVYTAASEAVLGKAKHKILSSTEQPFSSLIEGLDLKKYLGGVLAENTGLKQWIETIKVTGKELGGNCCITRRVK